MKLYISLSVVFVLSFVGAYILPLDDLLRGVFATPALLAMFGALFQILRDRSTYERQLQLQRRQEVFNLGATSHMANVAFDKHVEFCDKYMKEVHTTVFTLFQEGPTEQALDHANAFHRLREEYAAWLTDDINENLFPFEQALRVLGANQMFVTTTSGHGQYAEQRSESITKVFEDFKRILTIDKDQEPDPTIATEVVKKKVRDILGIEELVQLRNLLLSEAIAIVATNNKKIQPTSESGG